MYVYVYILPFSLRENIFGFYILFNMYSALRFHFFVPAIPIRAKYMVYCTGCCVCQGCHLVGACIRLLLP